MSSEESRQLIERAAVKYVIDTVLSQGLLRRMDGFRNLVPYAKHPLIHKGGKP